METNEQQAPEQKKTSKFRLALGVVLMVIAVAFFIFGVLTRGWLAIGALVLAIGLGWLAISIL